MRGDTSVVDLAYHRFLHTYASDRISIPRRCHTDTDPIKKSGHKSNHHLGFERAYAVMKYLVSRGVPESSIEVCSYGPNDPKSSKSTSRRVEISVVTD